MQPPLPAEELNIDPSAGSSVSVPSEYKLKARELELSAGVLGRIFGSAANAPMNIAGLVALLLLGPGIALLFVKGLMTAKEFWETTIPILTLILGYLFGKKA